MIVTIDGPAGAGKSTVARKLAQRLKFHFLDTGAMYRAVVWCAVNEAVDLRDPRQIVNVAKRMRLKYERNRIFANGRDVTDEIRTPDVTKLVKIAAGNPEVREILARVQQFIGQSVPNLVTEGRDQGTVVFPNAECKIFLTATPEERAKRRYKELVASGAQISFSEVLESQNQRDLGDEQRAVGPLARAEDAIEVFTDGMAEEDVLIQLEWVVNSVRSKSMK